jgi:hypothetical protein
MTPASQPRTKSTRSTKAWITVAASASMALYAGALLYEGFVSKTYSNALTLPFVDEAAARRTYVRLLAGGSLEELTAATQRLVRGDPANPESWAAAAFASRQANGHLTAAGLDALERSYGLAFFNRPLSVWRVGFALDNWPVLTPALRRDATVEARVALADPALRSAMVRRLRSVNNPSGRLAAMFMLAATPAPLPS